MLVSTFNQNYSNKIKTSPSYCGYNKSTGALNKGLTSDVFVKSVSFTGKLEDEFRYEVTTNKNEDKLLDIIANPKFCCYLSGYFGWTPLHLTIHYGLVNATKALLNSPAIDISFNHQDKRGNTPLLTGCFFNSIECVKELLKHRDIDISIKNEDGETALDVAERLDNLEIVKLIEDYQNGNNVKEKYPEMIQKENIDLKQLKEVILSPNVKENEFLDDQERSPLHTLAETDTPDETKLKEVLELIGLCIEKGVDINAQDNLVNETALFGAYRKKNKVVAEFLLSKGANPDIQNVSGDTVFHYACFEGNEEMVKLILKYNPDLMIKNNQDKTGLDYAKEKGHQNIVNLINGYIAFKKSLE